MRLRDGYEALLLDLDGTLYRGSVVIEGGPAELAGGGQRLVYVTNNASRAAGAVAAHLAEMGYPATEAEVVTSAQAAVRLLADLVDHGAEVMVVGTDDLAAEVKAAGLQPVRRATVSVAAVVQGHSPQTAWPDLAEASYALRAGAVWVAANTDRTLPNERGLAPGNGAMVAALRAATDREPLVAGKPCAPLLENALERAGTRAALVVGDRLDTDIDGAANVAVDSLLVLTGVSTIEELTGLPTDRWPTYIAGSLAALNSAPVPFDIDDPAAVRRELEAQPGRALRVRAPRSEIR
ncbi:HAD-IIA family hydrolase [Nocardia speluncae]|uniref:HAD-IIA family hydrolase n=1 Tax=Nocardia speluncae TaxID=419477 RepID=A0A846XGF6_9NOCA|nr:HAD-IIA family hydrolase [Nocardia speluncae]NKY33780.1 HAD-IIA family hydrolase [Nocardia speluncae]